jgi:VWFA-related protein
LDVLVTDAKGNLITGLKREDFNVTEADKPQTLLNFEQAGAHTPPPDLNINSTAELDRLAPNAPVNIILLDEFNTRFEDMAFARYSLKKYLQKQPGKLSMPTMLIAVSLNKFSVLQDYTQNKDLVLSALDHHFAAYPWQTHNGGWLSERYSTAFATLMRVAEATVGHQGHKNMIWIGRGFPNLNLANVPLDTENRLDNAVQECVNMLRDARVTLYAIDPAGLMIDPGKYGADAAFNDPFGGNYQFSALAKATGGTAMYGKNDVDVQIGTSIRDGASFYTLTYRPTNVSLEPRKFRRIKVTINQPGLTATTREGYYLQHGPAYVNPTNPSRRVMFDLLAAKESTMAYDGVPVIVVPSATEPDSYTVHISGKGLVWTYATETEPRHADVLLLISIFDKKGKELKQVAKSIHASATAAPDTPPIPPTGPLDRNLNIVYKVDPNPKAVRARFVVRVSATGRVGTADVDLTAKSIKAAN